MDVSLQGKLGYHSVIIVRADSQAQNNETQARQNLRQTLHALRRRLPQSEQVLQSDSHPIALEEGAIEIDALVFEQLARQTDMGDAALDAAIELYRGDFLDGFYADAPEFDDWRIGESNRLRELALTTMTTRLGSLQDELGVAPEKETDELYISKMFAELEPTL